MIRGVALDRCVHKILKQGLTMFDYAHGNILPLTPSTFTHATGAAREVMDFGILRIRDIDHEDTSLATVLRIAEEAVVGCPSRATEGQIDLFRDKTLTMTIDLTNTQAQCITFIAASFHAQVRQLNMVTRYKHGAPPILSFQQRVSLPSCRQD